MQLRSNTGFKSGAIGYGREDDTSAYTNSVTINLKSALGPRLDHLSESQQGVLPTTSPYPRYTRGLILIAGTEVLILHGRSDGRCRVQLNNPYAISRYKVGLDLRRLFTDACEVRIHCLQVCFKVRDFGAEGNGRSGSANAARRRHNGTRATPKFRRNSIGLPWYVEWDADSRTLQLRVALDRDFLAACEIATLLKVVGLRELGLCSLLSPEDIAVLPVPLHFSSSREVLAERLQRMLEGFSF